MIKILNLHIAVREFGRDIPQEEYSNVLTDTLGLLGVEIVDGTLTVFSVDSLTKKEEQ